MLHIFFPLNRSSNIVMDFEINEPLQAVRSSESLDGPLTVLGNPTNKITRDTDIERPVRPIGEDVDVTSHAPIFASVDGRDKPGHDGGWP